jgi:hypothetical protein
MEEIQSELKEIKRMMKDVSYQMQELREGLRRTSFPAPMLPMPQPYQHPWWEYQRIGSQPRRNNLGGQVQASGSINLDQAGSGVSGTTKAA